MPQRPSLHLHMSLFYQGWQYRPLFLQPKALFLFLVRGDGLRNVGEKHSP